MGTGQNPTSCGEQGLARPQLHLHLGRSCLSPGSSGCPSPSIKAPREFKNGNSTIPGVKKSTKFPQKRVILFQLCFTRTALLFLPKTASLVFCARSASCALGMGTLDLLWGSLWSLNWSQPDPWCIWNTDYSSCTGCFGLCYCFCGEAWVSAVCAQELTIKERIVAKAKNCKGTASLPGTCGCGALSPCDESHPAKLDSSLQAVVGWGFCAVLIQCRYSLTFEELQSNKSGMLGWGK